ncbi:amino acid ABC transporter permease [Microbacteriaceae bacterium VKM Ac-2854]|nr:amino acid ABC transporter permease [Microbacteriaceae bacterium VKM Ac-2854]
MSSVLFDNPGPKARARNAVLGVLVTLVVAGIIGFIVYRMYVTGQFDANKWLPFRLTVIWQQIFAALGNTLSAFAAAGVLSLVFGFVLSVGRLSDHKWVSVPFTLIIELFRAIPVLVLMMFLYYGFPTIGISMTPWLAVVIALTLYNGSVLAEVFRAGIESLPSGQKEAGYAIGLRKSGVMRLILYPQAIRAMLPVIIAQLVVTLKDTALGSIITYDELLYFAKLLGGQLQFGLPYIPVAIVISAVYIGICLLLSGIAKWTEIRINRSPKVVHHPAERVGTDTELIAKQE